jgi:esterase/lipase
MVVEPQPLNPSLLIQVFKGRDHQPSPLAEGQPAALLVHGFPGTLAEMKPLDQLLNLAGWTIKGLLFPGFGSQLAAQVETKILILQGTQDTIVKPHLTRQLVNRLQTSKAYREVNIGNDVPDPTNLVWSQIVEEIWLFLQQLVNPEVKS